MTLRLFFPLIALLLAGCDIPGMGPDPRIAQREAEAKAIGGACRHGLRSIEDCYANNEEASKAAVFSGWKEMDEYMRENKIEGVRATPVKTEPVEEILPDVKPKNSARDRTDKAAAKDKPVAESAAKSGGKKPDPDEKPAAKTAAKTPEKPARPKE
ncbi:MAG: hypothetical protein RIS90_1308 [Pseudomonadota bacterium]